MADYGILGSEEKVDEMVARFTYSHYSLVSGDRYLGDALTWDGLKMGVRMFAREDPDLFPLRVERDRVHIYDVHLDEHGNQTYRSASVGAGGTP